MFTATYHWGKRVGVGIVSWHDLTREKTTSICGRFPSQLRTKAGWIWYLQTKALAFGTVDGIFCCPRVTSFFDWKIFPRGRCMPGYLPFGSMWQWRYGELMVTGTWDCCCRHTRIMGQRFCERAPRVISSCTIWIPKPWQPTPRSPSIQSKDNCLLGRHFWSESELILRTRTLVFE